MLRASSTPASASSTTPVADASLTSAIPPTQTQAPAQSQSQSPSSGKPTLKLVHVAGTKYIDYFTDGAKAYSFPGSPDIDSNLTSGMEAFDTPSGDLDAGDHAQEANGFHNDVAAGLQSASPRRLTILSFVTSCHGPASFAIGSALTTEGAWNGLPSISTITAVGTAAATNIAIAISSDRFASI